MEYKVTAILPSYNVAAYIEQCVQSVLDQTLQETEILCIDAGSTDGTWEKLEKLAAENPRICLYKAEVKSYGYQMNLGIRKARGEYIAIIETDDYADPDMFELLYNVAAKSKADVSKAAHYELYEYSDGACKEIPIDYIPENYLSGTVFSPDEHPEVHDWDSNIWNALYRREFLLDHKIGFQETPGAAFQDIAFQQMVWNEAEKVVYSRYHIYHYRRVRVGASTWNPNCVKYVHKAYSDLFADPRTKESHKRWLYIRMIRAFFTEYRKTLCGMEKCDHSEAVDWFEDQIKEALRSGLIETADIWPPERDEILRFLIDRELYTERIIKQADAVYRWLGDLKQAVAGKKVIIFGAGQYGMLLLPYLIKNGINVMALADNQIGLTNNTVFGLRIYSADEATRNIKDAYYIIANKRFGEQIRMQLTGMGVSDDYMTIFDGADRNLLDGLRRLPLLPERKNG
ncbi:MAG: glycosyltransferase [Lachnospiraceae bacterium]|nr:glycosyltransferase [Lachnospiraceae bacterium]